MMVNKRIKIRKSVFETNSSSTHSVCISCAKLKGQYSTLFPDCSDFITVNFGEFGWGPDVLSTPYEKLQYLVTLLIEITAPNTRWPSWDEFIQNNEEYKMIDTVVYEFTGYHINIDEEVNVRSYNFNGDTSFYWSHNGYIDHQSAEFNSIEDFLNFNGVSCKDFIFNNSIFVNIDNDNH